MNVQALRNKPILESKYENIYNAYSLMHRSRRAEMSGALPIPLTEIECYCRLFDVIDRELLITVVIAMDNAYLDWVEEHANRNT